MSQLIRTGPLTLVNEAETLMLAAAAGELDVLQPANWICTHLR